MPDTIPGGQHSTGNDTGVTQGSSQRRRSDSDAVPQGWFQQLQALEDAIAYRRARAAAPCPDCTADGRRCDDHACDLHLIAAYQQTAIAAIGDVSASRTLLTGAPSWSPLPSRDASPPKHL